MIQIYGSHLCPDCNNCTLSLDKNKIPYVYYDITKDIHLLHKFLERRDTLPFFDHVKEIHDIGLPTRILDDGTRTRDWEAYLKNLGLLCYYTDTKKTCSIDGKGC